MKTYKLSAEMEKRLQEECEFCDMNTEFGYDTVRHFLATALEEQKEHEKTVMAQSNEWWNRKLATALEEQRKTREEEIKQAVQMANILERNRVIAEVLELINDSHIELTSRNAGIWEIEIEQYNQALDDLDAELRAKLVEMKGKTI